jgi:hypothetical protein
MNTDGKPDRSRPVLHTLFSFVSLVTLLFAALLFDHSLIEQIRGLLNAGHWPSFAASTRLMAYLITTYVVSRLGDKPKRAAWLICSASAGAFVLAALWL